ncbi:MAG: Unknown protein [uncultured Thiotrichaceae bacterium]|uniref:Uncharacterized protein n=1 Tax=uncultured Thiotrichaceae bacterium TaxID=298394 RepID=A0A6S6SLY2_9GAMM|nr:MAG: Unknown protein [uncultured Thiotrichaceae bacterium]
MSELDNSRSIKFQVFTNPDRPEVRSNIYHIPQLSCVTAPVPESIQVLDVAYHQVVNAKGCDFRHNVMMVVDLHDTCSFFPNMGFVEVERTDNGLVLSFEVNFQFTTWQHSLNLLSYIENLRERMFADHGVASTQEDLYEEDLLHLKFLVTSDLDDAFAFTCQNFSDSLELAHNYILSSYHLHKLDMKEIRVPQEYTQSAHLILNFLVAIMKRRMPHTDIRQTTLTGMNQSLVRISHPRSVSNTIETILVEYAELIMGTMKPECFFASSSVMNAFCSRMAMVREEMSLVLSSSGKQTSDECLDNEMKALKIHLSNAIKGSISQSGLCADQSVTSNHESSPELSA